MASRRRGLRPALLRRRAPRRPVPSILRTATRDDAVMVVHSFSKSYCMTGWRVGWLVARRDLAAKATQLNEFIVSHAPSFAQKAGETALAEGEGPLVEMIERLKGNRDLCLEALSGHSRRDRPKPDGAFYLFPRIQGLVDPSHSANACWRKPGSVWRQAWPSAPAGRVRSGSVMQPSVPFLNRHGAPDEVSAQWCRPSGRPLVAG